MKKIISIILVMIFVVMFASCGNKDNGMIKYEVDIYYVKAGENELQSERTTVEVAAMDELYNAILNKMIAGPADKNLEKLIPDKTTVLGTTIEDGILTINFSKELYNINQNKKILLYASLVKTMTHETEISGIRVFVEGETVKNADGEPVGILKQEDFIDDNDPEKVENEYIKLYFSNATSEYLVAEAREITISPKETLEMRIVKEILKGPVNTNLIKTIPAETEILSVETKEGVCFVNLSQEFKTKHSGGSAGETMTIYSIVNSLTELENVEKVQFLIEGQKKEVFIHMIFNEPFTRNQDIIQK